ncbi:MAG: SEC-C metal-binding domain-containing protein [Actinomycetota bacterium]|nr:SEC-C metal-binding domain-containing protein [Actinomycetota bacterium]
MELTPEEDAALAAAFEELAAGPLPFDELLDRLQRLGIVVDTYELDEEVLDGLLITTDSAWTNEDGIVALTSTLLDGAVFTHRISADELARGVVDVTPDLVALDYDLDAMRLPTGESITVSFPFEGEPDLDDHGSLRGPPGWLAGYAPDDLVAFSRSGDGVRFARIDDAGEGTAESDALGAAWALHYRPGMGVEPFEFVLDAMCENPALFRSPVVPVTELLGRAGLRCVGAFAGRADEPFEPPGVVSDRLSRERIERAYGFDRCCSAAFDIVVDAWREWVLQRPGARVTPPAAAGAALAHGFVAIGFAQWVTDALGPRDQVGDFATALCGDGPIATAAALYVRAYNAEMGGRVLDAEDDLVSALRADPENVLAALELAEYAFDRGDISGAIARRRQAGVRSDDPQSIYLAGLARRAANIGRNDRCPCGSGRKYKACCLVSPKPLPLEGRGGLLWHKLARFAVRPARRATVVGIASSACDPDDPDFGSRLVELAGDPFVVDLAVFEGGAADDYLETRGVLLPDDERDALAHWCDTNRRLWEITACDPGRTMTLRDTATGATVVVVERAGSQHHQRGEYLLGRVVPVGSQHQLVGQPLLIGLRHRASLLHLLDSEPDADAFAAFYGDMLAPPVLTTREGEPFGLHRAVVRGDSDALVAVLDTYYEFDGDQWVETVEIGGDSVVRAAFEFDDDGALSVMTFSAARLSRVLDVLRSEISDLDIEIVLDDEPHDGEPHDGEPHDGEPLDLVPVPDAAALIERLMREHESAWLDESVPALAGLTPRQAAADPTRREDLIALLAEFDRLGARTPAGAATFDAGRLRAALGIEG